MCGDGHDLPVVLPPEYDATEPFPWAAGRICDAHCHPTDTMAAVPGIPAMAAAVLTVMATRSQDQDLVAALAVEQGRRSGDLREAADPQPPRKVVAAFGWHPWFAHQLYDDGASPGRDLVTLEDKRRHLAAVLLPAPAEKHAAALEALAASLPAVRPLSAFVAETRQRLQAHPTALVGEIGLDKSFRVPEPAPASVENGTASGATPGGREGRRLSPFRVLPAHQTAVLEAQLRLAVELGRPISVHGVQAHGLLFETLAATWRGHEREVPSRREKRKDKMDYVEEEEEEDEEDEGRNINTPAPYPPSICLHSFSAPVEMLRQYIDPRIPAAVYFSFSTVVNASSESVWRRTREVVAACPDDRLLVESDLHVAGPPMDAMLEDMYRRVCDIKGWTLAEGVERVAQNYEAFVATRRV